DIVQWAAGKIGVPDKMINTLSTYRLEQEVSQKFLSKGYGISALWRQQKKFMTLSQVRGL
ncbi:MAG: hypothetical protein IJQ58_01100, partial [Synergistaceae bacterium]|nr:hypothetical protein [Synergistaceae bacterium]